MRMFPHTSSGFKHRCVRKGENCVPRHFFWFENGLKKQDVSGKFDPIGFNFAKSSSLFILAISPDY